MFGHGTELYRSLIEHGIDSESAEDIIEMLVAHKANLEVRTAHSGLLVSKAWAAWDYVGLFSLSFLQCRFFDMHDCATCRVKIFV